MTVEAPDATALVMAAAASLSLNDHVGLRASSLSMSLCGPSRFNGITGV